MRFSRRHGTVTARLDRVEADVLSAVAGDLLVLLGEQDEQGSDPLAALVGLSGGPAEPPADPALARLLPDAYGDDEAAAGDFRRYTEGDLRAGKRANATVLLSTLAPLAGRGGRLVLDRDQAAAWLGCLNDLRLVLGTRLGVTEETELDPRDEDPRAQALQVYGWLGWLQESLLGCLDLRGPR
ncbi:MAG: DUF2017 domain-containing protein [Mycobacteriales bacterium]